MYNISGQTIYYDPESIHGLNLYAYCLNNPVMYVDPLGASPFLISLILSMVIGGFVAVGVGIAGAVAIYYLGEAVDYIYEKFKEWIFE